jgi:hypothetical protein
LETLKKCEEWGVRSAVATEMGAGRGSRLNRAIRVVREESVESGE